MNLPEKFAFIDVETTGGNCARDRIIEIGLIRVENNKVTSKYQSLVDPDQYLPPEISQMTGITTRDLERAPTFRQIADEVEELMSDCVFVAHNARFDYGFVKAEFGRLQKKLTVRQLCTVRLSRHLYPEYHRHNLDEVAARFGLTVKNRHRALDDAVAIWNFFKKAKKQKGATLFEKTVGDLLLHPSTPEKIAQSDIDRLPPEPGVYIFYGESGMPLYVGKSINIKDRVLSHLSASLRDAREMRLSSEVASIETEVCSGELGAFLREASLIKKLQPLHNRMLRQSYQLVFVELEIKNGFKTMRIAEGEGPDEKTVGVFKTRSQATDWMRQKCKEQRLCAKLLGLEKMRKTCFEADLGRCTACLGEEDPILYNLRFDMAVAENKIANWPFGGPIVINENNEAHVFDKWCYLGQAREEAWIENSGRFDVDTYKILKRFIREPKNMKKIKVVSSGRINRWEN